MSGTSERSYCNQVGQGRPQKEWGHVTLELRTGSDDITSNMCGLFLVTHHYLSVHFCDSVLSMSSNCCLDDLEI